jgi:hypothetical protein
MTAMTESTTETGSSPAFALAMVLLPAGGAATPETVEASLARHFPEVTFGRGAAQEGASFSLTSGDGAHWIFSQVPGPLPEEDVRGAIALSPGITAEEPVLGHASHLIVASRGGELSAIERRRHLSIGVAAAAEASSAVAVFWTEGSVLHEVEAFIDEVKADPIPVASWFGVSVARPTTREIELLSVGLPWVGHPDLLVSAKLDDADAAFAFLYDCASYAVAEGHPLKGGESIGFSEKHSLPIEAIDSPVEPGAKVLRIRFTPPRR